MSESSSSGLRLAMRHARSMFPGFRRPTGDDEQEPGSNDDASKLPWRRPDNARSTSESTARRISSQGSDAVPDTPDILLTRNDSSASRHSRASSGASTGPPSRKSSLQRSLQTSPLQEIPEPVNEAVVTPAAPAPAPVPPPPPPPPELTNDKRALFLRARTKSIDHMHRFLHIRQFTKENKGKPKKKKKQEGDTLAVPDPGPIEAPPLSPRPTAVPPTTPPSVSPSTAPLSPLTDAVVTPVSHTSHREASSPTVAPPVIVPISAPAPGALETSGPLPPLPPPSPPADAEAPGPDDAHESEREARPMPPLPPRPSPPVDDSPAKPVSMRSVASGETQTSLTSLATATDTMDRSFATPDRVPLRPSSQSTSLAWDANPASLSPTQAGEASIGALALLPDDEGQATPMPPVDDMLARPIDTPVLLSDEPRSKSPTWPGWPMESVASASQSQSDAQGLLENLGLDDLDAGSAPPSASSMYSDVSVERIEAAQPDVPAMAPTPPKVRGMAIMPNDMMPVRAPPAHAVPSSESEPDSATSAPPPWMQRIKGRGPAASSETSPSASAGMGLAIDTNGPSLPSPPAPGTSEEDPFPHRPSEDDVMRSARPPLRTSKSSSLLTAMSQQAQRIRRNVRDAGASMGDDDDDDETNAARGKGRQASRRSESTEPLPITSPSSAVDLPALQKEPPSKSETPVSMYRTRRNKSQPTLRIADDLEFLHALEQVRLQHKERLAVRQRARSARKASMPNLRPPPSSRRPPLPMTRVVSDRGTVEAGVMGRPRASSLADRADESLMMSHPPETLDVRSMTPDASTNFLELESVASEESEESEESAALEAASVHASSEESEAISNELGIGHTTGNFPSAPFTNDDDWKKEVKALFLIRELVQTERSYAAHLESLLIVVLKWTGTTSSTRLPTNVLMPTQPSSSSQSLRMPTPTPTTPAHLVTLRQMLPKLISVSRALVYSIEESPTSEGVARSFLSMLDRFEDVHVSWHGVVGATLRSLRAAESSKSKAKGRLGRVPIAPPTTEPPRRLARADTSSSDPSEPERRDKTRSEPKELSAVDVAIMPTQRIPRYVLLLRDLLSYTSADSEAYTTLEAALRAVQDLGHRCDQASGST